MVNFRKNSAAKTFGSIAVAGALAMGFSSYLRADDATNTVAAASSTKPQTVEEAYTQALQYIKSKDLGPEEGGAMMIRSLKELPEQFTNSVDAQLIAANLTAFATQTKNYEKAVKMYDYILSNNPTNVAALVNKGVVLSFMAGPHSDAETMRFAMDGVAPGKFQQYADDALKTFDAVLKVDPGNFAANYNKGIMLNFMVNTPGYSRDAIKCFKLAADKAVKTRYLRGTAPDISTEQNFTSVRSSSAMAIVSGLAAYMIDNSQSELVDGNMIISTQPQETYISNSNDALAFCNYNIALCYAHPDIKDYTTALKYMDRAIDLNTNAFQFYEFRALIDQGVNPDDTSNDRQKAQDIVDRIRNLDAKYHESQKAQ
jgi:tetratricopeptide (TPR) repeat protein